MDLNVTRMETGVRIAGKTVEGLPKTIRVDADGNLITSINQDTPVPAGDNNIGNVDIASAIPTGTNSIGKVSVNSNAGMSSATFTRPADTIAYAANDVVGTADANITFENVLATAQQFLLTGAKLIIESNAIPSGMGGFTLHLFSVNPVVIADNAAFNIPVLNDDNYIGAVQLSTPVDRGDILVSQNDNINMNGVLTTTSLYGILTTDNAHTPVSATVYKLVVYTIGV